MIFNKGDKVRILRKDITQLLCPYGIVTRQDGGYVYVKPVWTRHEMELYVTEVEIAKPFWDGYDKEKEKQVKRCSEIVNECVDRYKHLDNCSYKEIFLNQLIKDVVIYALYQRDKK